MLACLYARQDTQKEEIDVRDGYKISSEQWLQEEVHGIGLIRLINWKSPSYHFILWLAPERSNPPPSAGAVIAGWG